MSDAVPYRALANLNVIQVHASKQKADAESKGFDRQVFELDTAESNGKSKGRADHALQQQPETSKRGLRGVETAQWCPRLL